MPRPHLRAVTADRVEVAEDYPDEFFDCRDLRHAWARLGQYHAYGEIVRVLICTRCKSAARDFWSPRGIRLRPRQYDYAEGYLIPGGPTIEEIRSTIIGRSPIYDTEAAMHAALEKRGRAG